MNDSADPIKRPLAHERITVRILMVIDGRVQLNKDAGAFGLGFVIETLRANWSRDVRIDLGLATREPMISDIESGGLPVLFEQFRFDQQGFQIDAWDQIWIFADQPAVSDDVGATDELITDENRLSYEEARVLAEWMDRGGGLFATGDHNNLGAAVCHRIPRVRTMRKWLIADGPPTNSGDRRNKTLQPTTEEYGAEYDLILQPLTLVYSQHVSSWPFHLVDRPHPILCSSAGPIDRFPDHMHEGELVADGDVQMDLPLEIPGYTRPEYPRAVPEVSERLFGFVPTVTWRPRPAIIAYGHTTNVARFEAPETFEPSFIARPDSGNKRFGIVGIYDGEAANIGRIVCDSTWHHWFSDNLDAIVTGDPPAYRKMQAYYRNVALWLAKRPMRQRMLTATVWNALERASPMEFNARQTPWDMGESVLRRISPFWGPCWVNELVSSHFAAASLYRVPEPHGDNHEPEWSRMPEDLVNKAVLGCLAHALYPLLSELRSDRTHKRDVEADATAIAKLAPGGISNVPEVLNMTLTAAIESLTELRGRLNCEAPASARKPI